MQDRQVVREHDRRRQARAPRRSSARNADERGGRRPGTCRVSSPSAGPGRASTSSPRRSRPRRSRSPTTASCRPERGVRWPPSRSPCTAPVRGGRGGATPPERSRTRRLELYEATPVASGSEPGAPIGRIPFQFNPKELSISKSAKWARDERARRQDARAAGVQRRRPVQADPRAVLRRHRHDGRQRGRPRRAAVRLLRADRRQPRQEEGPAPARRAALGRRQELRRLRHVGAGQVHAVHRRGHADPGHVQRLAGGDARRPAQAEPDVRQPRADARCARSSRATRSPRSPTASTATRRCGARSPLFNGIDDPLRPAAGLAPCSCPPSTTSWPGCDVAEAQVSNAFTVSVDGKPLPADLVPLLVSAVVDDSLNLPDLVILRFRDPDRTVLAKSGIEDRVQARGRRDEQGVDHAGAADHRRGHGAGGGVRRHRHVHRRPRVRPRAPALPRPAHRDLHAGHRVGRREEGRPARRAHARHGRRDVHGLRPRQPGRGLRLGVPRRAGPRDRARGGGQGRQVRVPRAEAGDGRARADERAGRTAAPAPGQRPRPLPGRRHLGRAGQGGTGPGLGRRQQEGARRHRPGEDPLGAAVRLRRRPDRPRQDVR